MLCRLLVLCLATFFTFPLFSISKSEMKMKDGQIHIKQKVDNTSAITISGTKTPYLGTTTASPFDKSPNGYGWSQGYNRKISWNAGNSPTSMIGSIYRRLNPETGTGTMGGMIGDWNGSSFLDSAQVIYDVSNNWGISQDPGGRYPFSCGFINGYYFGIFNDYNTNSGESSESCPMFTVADATLGYSYPKWSVGIVKNSIDNAIIPGAWCGTGDVVYDPSSGYYYWSQGWEQDLWAMEDYVISAVVGRSMTPSDASSWEWTDYRDLTFDCEDDTNGQVIMSEIQWAYCKDVYGNGTGYGIALAMANDVDDRIFIDSMDVEYNQKISYMYTTNWGGDASSGEWTPNWKYDTSHGDVRLFQLEASDLFDWYGTTFTEVDSVSGDTIRTVLNDPFITWNISSVATENNYVHILLKVFGGTIEEGKSDDLYYMNDDDFVAGYYHVRGLITDTGVIWSPAHFIASLVGLDTGEIEYVYANMNVLSIGYAGSGQVYATWLDRPAGDRVTPNTWPVPDTKYYDDGYFSVSCDDGDNWEIPTDEEAPGYGHIEVEFDEEPGHIYNLYYPMNVTHTSTQHEEGWVCSSNGKIGNREIEVYTVQQYYDSVPVIPPVLDFHQYQQFLRVWKITGSLSDGTGISAERVSLVNDFELMQNYPNPFNPNTEISFRIRNDAEVQLKVFNSIGETVAELVDGKIQKGYHKVNFEASKLNSGIYFYQLNVNGSKTTKKMVLVK